MKLNLCKLAAVSIAAAGLIACANTSDVPAVPAEQSAVVAADLNNNDLYEVHQDGRIYLFDDADLYRSFLKVGETPFVIARIGEGPNGETLKFGLTSQDKKKTSGIASVELYEGNLMAAEDFYGEMRIDGRVYVFSTLEDMNDVRKTGEAVFRYTDIGAGPKGETVVYVLNKANKKQKPDALMGEFKKRNGL